MRIFQEKFHSSRQDNYTKPQAFQKDILYIKVSSAHILAGKAQEPRMVPPASTKDRQNLVSWSERDSKWEFCQLWALRNGNLFILN